MQRRADLRRSDRALPAFVNIWRNYETLIN
jgi:hypothetical protein